MSNRFRPQLSPLEPREVPAALSFVLSDGVVGSGHFSAPAGVDAGQAFQRLALSDLTVSVHGVALTGADLLPSGGWNEDGVATADYEYGVLKAVKAEYLVPGTANDLFTISGVTATATTAFWMPYSSGYADGPVALDGADTQVTFTLPDGPDGAPGTVGSISYTIPWDQVDPDAASQSLAPTAFNLNIAGQNVGANLSNFTTAPALVFEYGVLKGLVFDLDTTTEETTTGFAYKSLAGSFNATGDNIITAIQVGTNQQFIAAAQKKQSMASLNFTDTYSTSAVNITVKVTLADGTVKQEVVLIPETTGATDLRNIVWSVLDDMPGIKADKTEGNRLTVKGTDKLLQSIEFTAGKDSLGRDPGITKLKAKILATADVTPVVKVNNNEVPK